MTATKITQTATESQQSHFGTVAPSSLLRIAIR